MPLITRSKDEVLTRIKSRFNDAGFTDVSEAGSPANVLASALATELGGLYNSVKQAHTDTDVTRAIGAELDKIAAMFGVTRSGDQPARDTSTNNMKFYIDPTINKTASTLAGEYSLDTITIPLGTIINAGSIQYKTTTEVSMSGNNTEVFTTVAAMGAGSAYNVEAGALSKHNLAAYPILNKLAAFIKCTNLLPISSGQDFESDEELRLRLKNANSISATANTLAVLSAARSVPGVADAAIVPYIYGSGTLAVFIESTTPIVSPGLINAVQDTIDIVKAEGNRVYVQYPDYKALKLKIEAVLRTGADEEAYANDIKPAVVNYINNLPRGATFVARNLLPILSANGIAVNATMQSIKVGDYNIYTRKLLNLQTFLATSQALSQTEKWYTNSSLIDLCIVNE